jgi:SNF2 family DNA or RNA helicase
MLEIRDVITRILSAKSTKDIKDTLNEAFLFTPPTQIDIDEQTAVNPTIMGVTKVDNVSINRLRKVANQAAMAVLDRVGNDHSLLTEADKDALRKYSGIGGTDTAKEGSDSQGLIHEFYTPTEIAEGVWDGLKSMGFGGGNSLEPSAGAGVFQETKPANSIMTATEIDKTSSHVNRLLHPEDMVLHQPFEQLAASTPDNTFDSCVGNVPFGSTRGNTAKFDPEYKDIKSLHGYFVVRTIDKVKPNGLIALVVPNGIVSGSDNKKIRQRISMKAEFLGAHRLPAGVFTNSGTETSTDIIFLRKHSEELAELISNTTSKVLKDAQVVWDTFINGRWFKEDGKRFMHGEEVEGWRVSVKNTGELSNAALKSKLSHRFESRINLESLNVAEPISYTYIEGDQKIINDRMMRFDGIAWQAVEYGDDNGRLDAKKYGSTSLKQIADQLNPMNNALSFTYSQLASIQNDFPYLIKGSLADYMKLAANQPEKYREQIIRGCLIGNMIASLHDRELTSGSELTEVANMVNAEIKRFGVAANITKLKALAGAGSGAWGTFVSGMDKEGRLSDFLSGKLDKGDVLTIDRTNASELVSYLFSVKDASPISLDDFLSEYEGKDLSLEQLAKLDGIAITADGALAPLDRATSGNIVQTKQSLLVAMGSEPSTAILENMQRQLDDIENKRKKTPVDSISMTMNAKWIPRDLVTEFLNDKGYDFTYSRPEYDDEGNLFENTDYQGNDGLFLGYRKHEGLDRKAKSNSQFEQKLESYLNGEAIRTSGAKGEKGADGMTPEQRLAFYKRKVKDLEEGFSIWLRQHSRIEEVTDLFNDTFNGFIPVEYNGKPLGLENTSGKMENFDYQCSEIRRLSESGTGICGFGTGLGKTSTALGLVAYNTQIGRAKRTVLVVPKSVMENWYHESNTFFSEEMFKQSLFIGFKPVIGSNGEIEKEAILENGEPKLNPITGEPVYRTKLVEIKSAAENNALLNSIPQSNIKFVVMSKEKFGDIALRPHSVTEHVDKMIQQGLLTNGDNKFKAVVKNHKDAMKNAKYREKYENDGTSKNGEIPYFEDMGFDNIIVDEGHNYRNSYSAGRESATIQYLPTAPAAKIALDMAIKSQYLKQKNDGRGTVLLTATPTVNSPTDIFNMLSHIMTPDDWGKFGIVDVDDFIRVFGETAPEEVEKLSGEIETKDALVGFKNLSGLRSIFHRYVNLKNAEDIKDSVIIPEVIDIQQECEMSEEQREIYEDLRDRAGNIIDPKSDEARVILAQGGKLDTTFGIIRDMDRVTTDIDLYKRQLTFIVPISQREKLNNLVADLPDSIDTTKEMVDATTGLREKVVISNFHGAKFSVQGDAYVLVVHEAFDLEVNERLAQFDISEKDVSHPITPKYAMLIENIKKGLEVGKQIVFTEEKSQHKKLKRILVNSLGLDEHEVGIINADAIAKKGRATSEDEDDLDAQGSLEEIAIKYNGGQIKVLICNKKAEVGINLHINTQAIHHLTLPWTPASIKQRNGRGSRVGAPQKSIDAVYYIGKGSFDDFRLKNLKRKADWMDKLFNGTEETIDNADASDAAENNLLLAKDPEELAARIAAAKEKKAAELKKALDTRANIDLANFIKAHHDLALDAGNVQDELDQANARVSTLELRATNLATSIEDAKTTYDEKYANADLDNLKYDERSEHKYYKARLALFRKDFTANRAALQQAKTHAKKVESKFKRKDNAERQIKQLRSVIEAGIRNGSLNITSDVLTNADNYIVFEGRTFKVGNLYNVSDDYRGDEIWRIVRIDFDGKLAVASLEYSDSTYQKIGDTKEHLLADIGEEASYTPTELEVMVSIRGTLDPTVISAKLTKEQFYHYLSNGLLKIAGDHIIADGNSFAVRSKYGTTEQDRLLIIYPDSGDESLKKRLSLWMLENREQAASYKGHVGYFKAVLGNNWETVYESYGVQAPEHVINAWAMSNLAQWQKTDEGIETEAKNLNDSHIDGTYVTTNGLDTYCHKNYPTTYANLEAFRESIDTARAAYRKLILEKRTNILKSSALPALAAFKAAGVDKSAQLERIEWIKRTVSIIGASSDLLSAAAGEHTPYSKIESFVGTVVADLMLLTQSPASADNLTMGTRTVAGTYQHTAKTLVTKYVANRVIYDLQDDSKTKADMLAALNGREKDAEIAKRDRLLAQEKTDHEREIKEAEEAKAIVDNLITDGTITIQLNKNIIVNTKFKRWKLEALEAYAISDSDGKNGRLSKVKTKLKQDYNAEFCIFTADTGGLNGAYWFVRKADIELSKLKTILGMN